MLFPWHQVSACNSLKNLHFLELLRSDEGLTPDPSARAPKAKGETEMTKTNLSGTEIAKLTAMISGGGFKRANSKEAGLTRFYNVASDKKIAVADAAAVIESIDYQAACSMLSGLIEAGKAKTEPKTAGKKPTAKNGQKVTPAPAAGKRAAIEADAKAGNLPAAPDFSAETHKPYRKKLAEVVALVEKKDIKALKALQIPTYSSSPKAISRYRDLAVIAIEAAA